MKTKTEWQEQAKRLIKGELAKKKISYARLEKCLRAIGVDDNEANLRNKISRGKFSVVFLLQCIEAIENQPE